jgi:hypothetical protein
MKRSLFLKLALLAMGLLIGQQAQAIYCCTGWLA